MTRFRLQSANSTRSFLPNCSMRFQVDGIFGYCPGCHAENLLLYDANLSIIRQEISSAANPDKALRHAYSDLVSTFETFCRKEAERQTTEGECFQNLECTRRLFKDEARLDITAQLTDEQKRLLKRVFQKKAICTSITKVS